MEFRFFEIYRSTEYLNILLEGIITSFILTVFAATIGFGFAIILSGVRYAKIYFLDSVSTSYTEFIRNTPLIVQLFFVTFGLPILLNYQWPFWAHALLALILNFSAYFAEILRAGFVNISKGQLEGAMSMGLSRKVIFYKIVLPQAVAKMYPSLVGQFIFLFLTTGIISEIGVQDLTHAGLFIDSRSFRSFEVFTTLTVLYIGLSLFFKYILSRANLILFPYLIKS